MSGGAGISSGGGADPAFDLISLLADPDRLKSEHQRLAQAKADAEAAVALVGKAKDIDKLRADALAKQAAAQKALDEANAQSQVIVDNANKAAMAIQTEADAILADAKAQAKDAAKKAKDAATQAAAVLASANAIKTEVDAKQKAFSDRSNELDVRESKIAAREAEHAARAEQLAKVNQEFASKYAAIK
jgi:hypothetical protein